MARSRLVDRREQLGLSQKALARMVEANVSTVRRWEKGQNAPLLYQRRPLADALQVPLGRLDWWLTIDDDRGDHTVDTLGGPQLAADWDDDHAARLARLATALNDQQITPDAAPRLVHEWLVVDPPQHVELRAGRRIGGDLVARVAGRVDQLRHLDDVVAGADLEGAVNRELTATSHLVSDAAYPDRVGRRLLSVLADLCQLAGWVAADAGHDRLACHRYATGIAAAHAANDRPLAGQLASTLAYHLANTADPHDAVLLAQSAIAGSTGSTATTQALFLERLAWAHARADDRRHTERALGAVEDAYAHRDPDDDPAWTYWLAPEEIDVMAGRCWVELGLPGRAVPVLDQALDAYSEDRPREAALYTSWLAEAHLQAGDIDHAAQLACRMLDLTSLTASVRTDHRARHLRQLLHPHLDIPVAADFEDRYRTLTRS